MQFLGNILTGFIVVNLLPLIPNILRGMKFVGANLHYFFLGFKGVGLTIRAASKSFRKNVSPIIDDAKNAAKPVTEAFGKVGQRIKNLFKGLSKVVPNFIKTGFSTLKNAVRGIGEGAKNLGRTLTFDTRSAQLGASAKNLKNLTGTAGQGVQQASSQALRMRRMHGDEAARMYKGLVDNGMSNTKAAKYVTNQIKAGKLTSAPLKGSLGGGLKGSKVFKGGPFKAGKRAIIKLLGPSKAVKTALRNIPVIGPIIVGVTSLLAGEPAAQALFKAGGTFVGGLLGLAIPIPILGPIIGEIIGEYVGDLMYTLLLGGGPSALMKKMKDDISAVMSAGKMALDWTGRGFGRFFKGVPKMDLWLPFKPAWMDEIPDPIYLMNPFNIFDKLKLFHKAFFTDDPVGNGKKKDKDGNVKPSTSGSVEEKSEEPIVVEQPKLMTEQEYYNARVEDHGLPDTYEEYKADFEGTTPQTTPQTPLIPGANKSTGEAMATGLRTGASQYIGGSSDYHIG